MSNLAVIELERLLPGARIRRDIRFGLCFQHNRVPSSRTSTAGSDTGDIKTPQVLVGIIELLSVYIAFSIILNLSSNLFLALDTFYLCTDSVVFLS